MYIATRKGFEDSRAVYGLLNRRFDDIVVGGIPIKPDDRREIQGWLSLAEATITKIEAGELDINFTYDILTAIENVFPVLCKYPCRDHKAPREVVRSGRIKRSVKAYIQMRGSSSAANDHHSNPPDY